MNTIVHCYWENIYPMTEARAAGIYGDKHFCKDKPLLYGYLTTRFDKFLNEINPEWHYLFIVAVNQIKYFKETLKNYDLEKYVVFKNPCPVRNKNYDTSERLHMFILKFDEDFVKSRSK